MLEFPLKLRRWKKGDVFYPFGGPGKKKISKYFKDERLSLVRKKRLGFWCAVIALSGWSVCVQTSASESQRIVKTSPEFASVLRSHNSPLGIVIIKKTQHLDNTTNDKIDPNEI